MASLAARSLYCSAKSRSCTRHSFGFSESKAGARGAGQTFTSWAKAVELVVRLRRGWQSVLNIPLAVRLSQGWCGSSRPRMLYRSVSRLYPVS